MASFPAADPKWKIARSFPRFAIDLPVRLHAPGAPGDAGLDARMVDIGLGGVCLVVEGFELQLRQKVAVEFRLPASLSPVRVKAVVRYHNDKRYGMQFLDLEAEDREKIRRTCAGLKII